MKINVFVFLTVFLSVSFLQAQRKELKGQLVADDDIEGIHIQNKTAAKYTVSLEDGSFVILAQANDTLSISGLKYKPKEIVITKSMEDAGSFSVALVEKINELDQVIVGEILTGSLESDLENSKAKTEINFYDLGIPGNTNLPLTQNEKKLNDADGGSWGYIGLGFGVNFHKLLNRISGRTKKLKAIVELDDRDRCINRLRREYESIVFENGSLANNLKNEYFMFCQEDESFKALCDENNDLKSIEFLQAKLKAYKKNRESATKD
ncbi:hypothetical protein [Winogradskyella flava]|uniref:hypothetical protein n=1 Tax=Winogradskyella flava TaxID=1884876 RepID=UPI0024934F9F|nr:hypothetical protein [Winogradskyella flava]